MVTRWGPARQRLAALAVLTAAVTGAAAATLGPSGWVLQGAGAYVAVAVAALFLPAAIPFQVIGGQALAGSLLLGPDGPAPLLLLPVVASVVATAELLALVARLDTPIERDPGDDLRRAALATLIAGGVYGAVVLAGRIPGPTGFLAVALSAGACVGLAVLLVRAADPDRGPPMA